MKNKEKLNLAIILVLGLIFILINNASQPLKAENRALAKAVFYVS